MCLLEGEVVKRWHAPSQHGAARQGQCSAPSHVDTAPVHRVQHAAGGEGRRRWRGASIAQRIQRRDHWPKDVLNGAHKLRGRSKVVFRVQPFTPVHSSSELHRAGKGQSRVATCKLAGTKRGPEQGGVAVAGQPRVVFLSGRALRCAPVARQ